jgi:hypothetical protein
LLERSVAIKIPKHNYITEREQSWFFREARAVAQLNRRFATVEALDFNWNHFGFDWTLWPVKPDGQFDHDVSVV